MTSQVAEQLASLNTESLANIGQKIIGGKLGQLMTQKGIKPEDLNRETCEKMMDGLPLKERMKLQKEIKQLMNTSVHQSYLELTPSRMVKTRTCQAHPRGFLAARMEILSVLS